MKSFELVLASWSALSLLERSDPSLLDLPPLPLNDGARRTTRGAGLPVEWS